MCKFVIMETNEIPIYQGTATGVLSTRVPVQIKMQFTERCMKYRLSVGDYLGYIVTKVCSDENLLNPEYLKKLADESRELNSKIESLDSELDKEREGHEKAVKAWKAAMDAVGQLSLKINGLEADLEASKASKLSVEGSMTQKHRELQHAAKKHVENAEKRYKEIEDRLTKANECLKEHGVTNGLFSNKVLQF